MLQELLTLWWKQKRRNFSWLRMSAALYFLLVIGTIIYSILFGDNADIHKMIVEKSSQSALVLIAMSFVPVDFFTKIFMKQESTKMDDSIRSRPISRKLWGQFLLISNMIDYWTFYAPVLCLIVSLFFMPVGYALLAFALSYFLSLANSLFLASYHAFGSFTEKLGNTLCYIAFLTFITPYVIFGTGLFQPTLHAMGLIILTLCYDVFIGVILVCTRAYSENKQKVRRVRSHNGGSLWTMNWAIFFRCNSYKWMTIIFTAFMLSNTYLYGGEMLFKSENNPYFWFYFFAVFSIVYPSMMVGQQMLGIEANFMDGLFSRPFSIRELLWSKYKFFAMLNAIPLLLLLPGIYLGYWTIDTMLSLYLFSFCINLAYFPSCLYVHRLEIFAKSYFKIQRNSNGFNFFGILNLLFITGAVLLFVFIPNRYITEIIISLLGITAIFIHRKVINLVCNRFMQRKYSRLETFRQ